MYSTGRLEQGDGRVIGGAPVPPDPRVAGLVPMLDCERVAALPELRRALGDVRTCQITYVRYKPRTNAIIAYALSIAGAARHDELLCYAKCFTEREYESALEKTAGHRWVAVGGLPPTIAIPEWRTIIYVFPNDTQLDGLRILSSPKKVQRALYAHHTEFPETEWRISDRRLKVTPVRYKPERRAVLRFHTRAINRETGAKVPLVSYMSIFTDDRGGRIFEVMESLHAYLQQVPGVRSPRPYAYLADRSALLVEGLPGTPVTPSDPIFGPDVVASTALALASVHRWDGRAVREFRTEEIVTAIEAVSGMLSRIDPEIAPKAQHVAAGLVAQIAKASKGPMGFTHGDFHHGQVFAVGEDMAFVDFERSFHGPQIADVGNYCAHLRLAGLSGHLADDAALMSRFIDDYRSAVPGSIPGSTLQFWTAVGLFLLAVRPFRAVDPAWRPKTMQILDVCSELQP